MARSGLLKSRAVSYIHEACKIALKPQAIAKAVRYAIEQPADVVVNEMIVRPMGGAF